VAKGDETRTILITGAASGIGRETALLFAERGWRVGGFDVDTAALEKLEQELAPHGGMTGRLDVTDKAAFDAAVAAFGEAMAGRLDLLHNNAGIGHSGWFEDVPFEDTLRLIQINFIGVVTGIYAAFPLLRQTPNSLCFSTSSSSAVYGAPRLAAYAATKFAVKGLTEALSVEFERHGVRAADVLPGVIDTPLLDATPNHSGPADEGILARSTFPSEGPFRLISAREVAECVWAAYHDESGRLHWYVPDEIGDLEAAKGQNLSAVRAAIRAAALGNATRDS
jgi:NAD(P)-dependent dehydrogenase (short-subunit alcohol dehydrogenase family)